MPRWIDLAVWLWLVVSLDAFYLERLVRSKRQSPPVSTYDQFATYTAKPRTMELPHGYKPYPETGGADSLSPTFPLAHTYSNGVDVNAGNINFVEGTLNVPIPGWGMWDLKGRQIAGPQTTWMNYGHVIQPVNMFNFTPNEMNDLISSPAYQEARANAKPIPVMTLPGGFVPANCRPPMCNPFIHQMGAAVQALPGNKNVQYDGLLDFPVPTGPNGRNVRFPLQGNFVAGKSPYMYTHGHVINPVNPFKNYNPHGGGSTDDDQGAAAAPETRSASLLEQTNAKSSFSQSASSVADGDSSEPFANLPPLPPVSG